MVRRKQKRLLLIGLSLLLGVSGLSGCGSSERSRSTNVPVVDQPAPVVPQQPGLPNVRVKQTTIASAITGITYPVRIYLPEDYESSTERYPVIYATDGQWVFNGFATALDNKAARAILVAIEQGPGDRRSVDYLMPGANDYYRFLTNELLPAIEQDYRIDSSQRTLSGTSYGGVLVGAVLLLDDVVAPHFKNYLSFDASFYVHPAVTKQLLEDRFNASGEMHVTLMLSSATAIGNDVHVTAFQQALEAKNFVGLAIHRTKYAVHHNNVAEPSFADALELIFPGQ